METPNITIKYVADYEYKNVREAVFSAIGELGGIKRFVKSSDVVLIKANLCGIYEPNKATTTHPNIIKAVAEEVIKTGAKCILVDSSNIMFNENKINKVYDITGMFDLTLSTNIELNKDFSYVSVECNGVSTHNLNLLSVVEQATAIINISKLKTSLYTGVNGCVENLFGFVPYKIQKQVETLYPNLTRYTNYLIDLEEYLHPKLKLNIVDAIVGMEGNGPINGTPRILNRIIAGIDPYIVDLVSLTLINYPIVKMPLIVEATKRNKFPLFNNLLNNSNMDDAVNKDTDLMKINNELVSSMKSISNIITPVKEDFELVLVDKNTKPHLLSESKEKRFSRRYNKIPRIDKNLCRGCSICYKICPTHAISMQKDERGELYAQIDYSKCIYCYKCELACQYKIVQANEPYGYKKITKNKKNSQNL